MSYIRYQASCLLCKSEVTTTQFDKHYNTKQCLSGGKFGIALTSCPFCNINLTETDDKANHVRWCKDNPNKYNQNKNVDQLNSPEAIKKRALNISNAHKSGKYKNAASKMLATRRSKFPDGIIKYSAEAIENCRAAAIKSTHQRKCKKSHHFMDKRGRVFVFDSSWEDETAIRLDYLNINWTRPRPIQYQKNGRTHNYFPDFYLPDHNVYLDPKAPWVEIQQKEKLDIVSKLINLIIIRSKNDCKNFII